MSDVCCTCFGPPKAPPMPPPSSTSEGRSAPSEAGERAVVETTRKSAVFFNEEQGKEIGMKEGDMDLMFFDAVEYELADDDYPIITTSFIPKVDKIMSFSQPETLLRGNPGLGASEDDQIGAAAQQLLATSDAPAAGAPTATAREGAPGAAPTDGKPKRRVPQIARRESRAARQDLEKPRVPVHERGYPGQLDTEELAACQQFYREIHKRGGAYLEIVYALEGVEDEPFAICRFCRATKFDAEKMLQRIEETKHAWETASSKDFYPDLDGALGGPLVLFLKYYPYFYYGNAKNGCPVNYFKAGSCQVEGLFSIIPFENTNAYYWHTFYYVFKQMMIKAKEKNPDFVRCESINVMDLKGLSAAQLSSETLEVIKRVSKITDFFPETLHCMLIINAPSWFALTWKIIKGFLDPRTARKIEVYSGEARGQKRLAELVEVAELPSDFGGTGGTLDEAIRRYCRKPGENRDLESCLMYVRKTETKKLDELVTLKGHESAHIHVYTRSVTGALISLYKDGQPLATQVAVKRASTAGFSESNMPQPYKTDLVAHVEGPGKISAEVKGLMDADSIVKKLPYGHFLLVADVHRGD